MKKKLNYLPHHNGKTYMQKKKKTGKEIIERRTLADPHYWSVSESLVKYQTIEPFYDKARIAVVKWHAVQPKRKR